MDMFPVGAGGGGWEIGIQVNVVCHAGRGGAFGGT